MTPQEFLRYVIKPAQIHYPRRMRTPAAHAMLLAIAMQESGLEHRVQLIGGSRVWWKSLNGPARGFWQFEKAGVQGVLTHPLTEDHIEEILERMSIPLRRNLVHRTLAYNDALATCFARLLLWTIPHRLPTMSEPGRAWNQYLEAWRPGKPHRDTWDANFEMAWRTILQDLECFGDPESVSWG